MTILRTAEQRKASDTCEKYVCTKDQCSALKNRGVTHAHITSLCAITTYLSLPWRSQGVHFHEISPTNIFFHGYNNQGSFVSS
jgi:hypothetical protein